MIGEVWGKLLHVAEDVKTGIRPNHKNAIENQPDQYQFILERIGTMLERLKEEHDLIS